VQFFDLACLAIFLALITFCVTKRLCTDAEGLAPTFSQYVSRSLFNLVCLVKRLIWPTSSIKLPAAADFFYQ